MMPQAFPPMDFSVDVVSENTNTQFFLLNPIKLHCQKISFSLISELRDGGD